PGSPMIVTRWGSPPSTARRYVASRSSSSAARPTNRAGDLTTPRGRISVSERTSERQLTPKGTALTRAPDDDVSGVDADPDLERFAEEVREAAGHREGGVEGTLRVVLLRVRSAERCHH